MDIHPLRTDTDYQHALTELMALESQGFFSAHELKYIEVLSELIEAFDAKHNPNHWCELHGITQSYTSSEPPSSVDEPPLASEFGPRDC